ncbi:RNA polymerase-binding protein DksA [Thioalkalivibrio sp. ALE11]|uniref:RNA polymerase-binding protein DksA n=1 Tax=Thioalkalivibrio sp. ALE11 TaxID=1265494 RepID=UPI00037C9CE3|nr:RNA polymerase-binding protein DksA [Thioalkalivibrio sp. ALE11]
MVDPGYRPSEDEPYMNPRQLDYFRRKLEAWRAELIAESEETLEHLRTENWQEPDPSDRATHEADAGVELRTRDRERKLLTKIDEALARIERGEYGYCEETGEPIGLERLEIRPIATLSVAAQEAHERDEARGR